MIDIKHLRENPKLYKDNNKKKNKDIKVIDEVPELDKKWRSLKVQVDNLRHERNSISENINKAKKSKDDRKASDLIKKAKEIPEILKKIEEEEKEIFEKLNKGIAKIPTLMEKKVPHGKSDKDNIVRKKSGKPKSFNFPVRNHVEIIENLGLGDFDASAKVSGAGFYYLKGDLALLNQALIRFIIDLMSKKKYTYIEPPLMVHKKVAEAAEDFEAFKTKIYKIQDEDLYLIPTSEHSILGMLSEKITPEKNFSSK